MKNFDSLPLLEPGFETDLLLDISVLGQKHCKFAKLLLNSFSKPIPIQDCFSIASSGYSAYISNLRSRFNRYGLSITKTKAGYVAHFAWDKIEANPLFSVKIAGIYTVTFSDKNLLPILELLGCDEPLLLKKDLIPTKVPSLRHYDIWISKIRRLFVEQNLPLQLNQCVLSESSKKVVGHRLVLLEVEF